MNNFEFLKDFFLDTGNEAFHWSEATHEELTQLIDFGFDMEIYRGDVNLSKNREAFAKVVMENVRYEDEVSDVIEYRFGDEKAAFDELLSVYVNNEKTIEDTITDVLADWVLNEKEKQLRAKDQAEYSKEMSERSYK